MCHEWVVHTIVENDLDGPQSPQTWLNQILHYICWSKTTSRSVGLAPAAPPMMITTPLPALWDGHQNLDTCRSWQTNVKSANLWCQKKPMFLTTVLLAWFIRAWEKLWHQYIYVCVCVSTFMPKSGSSMVKSNHKLSNSFLEGTTNYWHQNHPNIEI